MEGNHTNNQQGHPHTHKVHSHTHDIDYNYFQAKDGNIIWAGALTLAWKEMATHGKTGDHKHLTVLNPPQCKRIAENFNHSPFSTHDLDPASYYVMSGPGQKTVDTINKERAEKFKECTFPPIEATVGPNAIISYAYLFKKVMYPYKFSKKEGKRLDFHGINGVKKVESFYAEDPDQCRQVRIHEYKSKDEFTVSLEDVADKDEIFLCKAHPEKQVRDIISHISHLHKTKKDLEFIMDTDNFEVPILDLDYRRTLTELIGASVEELHGFTIEEILEGVKLKLDESGAVVENEALMMIDECAIMNPNPRILRFDSPFWVVMRQKGRHPYLCIKINDL